MSVNPNIANQQSAAISIFSCRPLAVAALVTGFCGDVGAVYSFL